MPMNLLSFFQRIFLSFGVPYLIGMAIVSILALSACGSSRLPDKVEGEMEEGTALKRLLMEPEFPSNTISYSGRLKLNSSDINASGTFQLFMENEKVCWLRLSKFGFEIGRARITPDSIIAINKLQNTYIQSAIEDLSDIIGSDLSFREIQHLVWGIPMRIDRNDKIRPKGENIEVVSDPKSIQLQYAYLLRPPLDLLKAEMYREDPKMSGPQELKVDQSDFHKITDVNNFPYLRQYSFSSPLDQLEIELNISTVELDESKNTDIRIPAHYTPY